MVKKNRPPTGTVDIACVIHGNGYDWQYVQNLYDSIPRSLSQSFRFHVYTEHDRSVPPHMIKHCLETWPGISGRKRSWWYKMHLFNSEHHAGPLLYFDLDVVLVRSLDWIPSLSLEYFWVCRDFKYVQNQAINKVNSSVMWFDTRRFDWLWQKFQREKINEVTRQYPGDQDYIQNAIDIKHRRFFPDQYFQSYRWQVADGGWDFVKRKPKNPGSGPAISGDCAVIVFHGEPKPHQVNDMEIRALWP